MILPIAMTQYTTGIAKAMKNCLMVGYWETIHGLTSRCAARQSSVVADGAMVFWSEYYNLIVCHKLVISYVLLGGEG